LEPGVTLRSWFHTRPLSVPMRLFVTGRFVYSLAVLGWGVLGLVYGDFVNSLEPVPAGIPGFAMLATLNGAVLAAAGLALMADFRTRAVAGVLAVLFASWVVLLHVPSAFIEPSLLRSPWWIRTFETLVLCGAALILAGSTPQLRNRLIRWGRLLIGVSLPVFGVLHLIYADNVASLIPAWYPWPLFWAYFTGLAHAAAGIAIATGVAVRWAATLAGIMYGLWALTLHLPRILDHPESYSGDRPELTSMLVAVALCGAAWIVAGSGEYREGHGYAWMGNRTMKQLTGSQGSPHHRK